MNTLIHQRVEDCRRGENPKVIARVNSGWVVLGDVQFLRGYSLLLPEALRRMPVWSYDWQSAPAFDLDRDRLLMDQIREEILKSGIGA